MQEIQEPVPREASPCTSLAGSGAVGAAPRHCCRSLKPSEGQLGRAGSGRDTDLSLWHDIVSVWERVYRHYGWDKQLYPGTYPVWLCTHAVVTRRIGTGTRSFLQRTASASHSMLEDAKGPRRDFERSKLPVVLHPKSS